MLIALMFIIAYLMGSIPTGLWIGQLFFKKNLHDHGSGNTGTTNTFRILGVKAGILVFAVDLLKGTAATMLPLIFHVDTIPALIFGLIAVVGHTLSIFDRFNGGKAVATSGGVFLAYSPLFLLYLFIVFVIVLYLFSMISLSSITAAIAAFVGMAVFPAFRFILPVYDPLFSIIVLALALLIILRHKSNLIRIKNKQESLVPFGLNLSKQYKK